MKALSEGTFPFQRELAAPSEIQGICLLLRIQQLLLRIFPERKWLSPAEGTGWKGPLCGVAQPACPPSPSGRLLPSFFLRQGEAKALWRHLCPAPEAPPPPLVAAAAVPLGQLWPRPSSQGQVPLPPSPLPTRCYLVFPDMRRASGTPRPLTLTARSSWDKASSYRGTSGCRSSLGTSCRVMSGTPASASMRRNLLSCRAMNERGPVFHEQCYQQRPQPPG